MRRPTYTAVVNMLSQLIGAFSDVDALLDNYMAQCDASRAESRTSRQANKVHARAIRLAAAALRPDPNLGSQTNQDS